MQQKVMRLAEGLTRATEIIGALLLASIVIMNLLQVFYRYALFDPLGWTEEVMRYSVVWMTFLVAGSVLVRGEQLSIDMLGNVLSSNLRKIQCVIVLLAIFGFCVVLVYYGWPQALRNMNQHSPSAQIPMIIPYASIVLGGLLLGIKCICLIIAEPTRIHAEMDALSETGDRGTK